jgi:hypothetical protein
MKSSIKLYKFLFLAVIIILGCNSQKRCARFVKNHPNCFKDTFTIKTDTIAIFYDLHDTTFVLDMDTVFFQTPCGEVQIIDKGNKRIKVSQKPIIERYETIKERVIHLPAGCDCEALKAKIKELNKKKLSWSRKFFQSLKYFLTGFFIGWLISILLDLIKRK